MDLAKRTLDYVAGVSWPRSGHHLLVRLLKQYFGPRFTYCEFYAPKDCCKVFPCARAGTISMSKNHDFDLDLPQLEGIRYVIQFRSYLPAVVSNFELHVCNGGEDSQMSFVQFASRGWKRYREFVDKWVHSEFARNQVVLRYEDLTDDPVAQVGRVIPLFEPDHHVDTDRLARLAAEIAQITVAQGKQLTADRRGVENTRDLRAFRYYDEGLFGQLAQLSLTRQEVNVAVRRHTGRLPAEEDMIQLQSYPDVAALERYLRSAEA